MNAPNKEKHSGETTLYPGSPEAGGGLPSPPPGGRPRTKRKCPIVRNRAIIVLTTKQERQAGTMGRAKTTTSARKGQPLTPSEREVIEGVVAEARRKQGYPRVRIRMPVRELARLLGRTPRTIRNELSRGACEKRFGAGPSVTLYSAARGQQAADRGRSRRTGRPNIFRRTCRDMKPVLDDLVDLVTKRRHRKDLNADEGRYAIYAATVRLNAKYPWAGLRARTIYYLVDHGSVKGLTRDEVLFIRRKPGKDRRKDTVPWKRKEGHLITDRPEEVGERRRFGDFEGDTVLGVLGDGACFFSFIERLTRYQFLFRSRRCDARAARRALRKLRRLCPCVRTVTFDNGTEFSDVRGMLGILRRGGARADVFFAEPYHPCQRASNENNHLLVRRGAPKGTKLAAISAPRLARQCAFINDYPRKLFNGHSARELYEAMSKRFK
mgnify:CR=1 FL=1